MEFARLGLVETRVVQVASCEIPFRSRSSVVLVGLVPTLLFGCINSVPKETVVVPASVELKVGFLRHPYSTSGIPVVSGRNGRGEPSQFILDTGSEGTLLSEDFASRMGYQRRWTVPYKIRGSREGWIDAEGVVRVDELAFDCSQPWETVAFRGFDALVLKGTAAVFVLNDVDGILGAPLLRDCTFTIDFLNSTLRLEARPLDPGLSHATKIRVDQGGRLFVPLELAGKAQWALLDTGDSSFLGVPEARATHLPLKEIARQSPPDALSVGGKPTSQLGLLDDLLDGSLDGVIVIAGHEFRNPFVTLRPGDEFAVGAGLLEGFALTIDQRSGLARLTRSRPTDWEE